MRESFVAPIEGRDLIGLAPGWPPVDAKAWPALTEAEGALLASGAADTNLVLHLEVTEAEGRFGHVSVEYDADGQAFRAQSTNSVEIATRCS